MRARRSSGDGSILEESRYQNDHLSVSHSGERWMLPGGDVPGDNCGVWRVKAVCDDCGHATMVEQHCDRWLCPDCWTRTANRFSINAAKRIQSYRYTQPDDHSRQWAHAVVSPTDGDVSTRRALFDNRTKAADIAQEKGFRGCAVVAHSHRPTDFGKELYRADVDRDDSGEPDIGFWVWLRNESDKLKPDTSDLIEWSPHYHIIGPTTPGMTEGKDSDEWMYHVIRFNEHDLGGVATSEDSHNELLSTFRYLASHILQPEDSSRQLITWHGDLANSVFVEDATEQWQTQKPSEGIRDAIKRHLKELAGPTVETPESDADGDESDDLGDCPERDCDGVLIGVWDINAYLDTTEPPPDVAHKMRVVRDWVGGEIEPPGGLKKPRCEKDARLAIEKML
jgi:ribosomal protein S27AE